MHPTLLPNGRGRAAIPWAIIKGLPETGVTMFKLDGGVDSGPIIAQHVLPIDPGETATSLYEKANVAHRMLMQSVWPAVTTGQLELTQQDEEMATEWPGRCPEDGRILRSMSVLEIDRLVRGTTRPYPGAFQDLSEETRLRVWAGSITEPPGGTAFALSAVDGSYFATDFDYEELR